MRGEDNVSQTLISWKSCKPFGHADIFHLSCACVELSSLQGTSVDAKKEAWRCWVEWNVYPPAVGKTCPAGSSSSLEH